MACPLGNEDVLDNGLRLGILVYTDGITESRHPVGEEFGDGRLIDLMLAEETLSAATAFCNGAFEDDLTVVAISVD